MLILLELFPNFFEVHYKLLQRILQNFDAGGLSSEWSFVRWSFVRTPGKMERAGVDLSDLVLFRGAIQKLPHTERGELIVHFTC